MSLKLRITLAALAFVLIGYFSAYYLSKQRADDYDETYNYTHMDGQSLIIAELWDAANGCDEDMRPNLDGFTEDFFGFTGLAYRVECKDSDFAAQSSVFPIFDKPFPDDADYYDKRPDVDGDDWLVINRETKSARIRVANASYEKLSFTEFIKSRAFWLMLAGILLVGGLFYFLTGLLLKPIERLRKMSALGDSDFKNFQPPQELIPLKNHLITMKDNQSSNEKLKSSQLDKERYFTANAAHELLTPLSAIKTEVQLQQRLVKDKNMKGWLGDLLTRVNRATHTVDQLMTLARLDPDSTPGEKTEIDIAMLLTEITDDYKTQHGEKFLTVFQNYAEQNTVMAYPALMETLLRNLISNASKYSPIEGQINIGTKTENNSVLITISNQCDRLPEYLVDQMFERFVRGPHEVETGSGLGLAIAKRIAELHQADLKPTIAGDKQSLTFELCLPLV